MISKEEREFYKLSEEYEEKFGNTYPLNVTDPNPIAYHNKRIKESLKSGVPVPETMLGEGEII